jgi:hypothetical protein
MNRRELFRWTAGAAATAGGALEAQEKGGWKPAVLDSHQLATINVLSDLIIPTTDTPGAVAAGVPKQIDQILQYGSDERRQQLFGAIAWLDGYSIEQHGAPFAKLTHEQQVAMLTKLDAEGPQETGKRVFRHIKNTVSQLYYNTAAGTRELNKGGRVPSTFGCRHDKHG